VERSIEEQVSLTLIARQEALKISASWYSRNKPEIRRVAQALNKITIQSARLDGEEVDINITGDNHTLKAAFGAFRKLGYIPSSRPQETKLASFSCYWSNPEKEAKFYLSFSSNKCTRVKVGTKTMVVDVYETVCE